MHRPRVLSYLQTPHLSSPERNLNKKGKNNMKQKLNAKNFFMTSSLFLFVNKQEKSNKAIHKMYLD
jgi:hypothetical protein